MNLRLPSWLKSHFRSKKHSHDVKYLLRKQKLHSVCEEAKCPNINECFSNKISAFMILGNICTRNCGFCAVKTGSPRPISLDEPKNIAKAVKSLSLEHVVITSVTRDDLPDYGASHFAKTIKEIRKESNSTIEVLVPDFKGEGKFIDIVTNENPDVFNHNIETIYELT